MSIPDESSQDASTNSCGDGLDFGLGQWKFDADTALNFESHAEKSIPGYRSSHELISILSDHFLVDADFALDVGCSTGSLLKLISRRQSGKKCEYLGIDSSSAMIQLAQDNNDCTDVKFKHASYLDISVPKKVDFLSAVYVVQFIRPKVRQHFINKVFTDLNWGGAFILFEKTRGTDSRFNEVLSSAYWEWKLNNGFTPDEIFSKSRSLRGIMEPFSHDGTIGMLKRAGFHDIETCFKWGPFQGLIAIK